MRQKVFISLLLLLTALLNAPQAGAQIRRGPKTIVRSGQLIKPDTLAGDADSLTLRAAELLTGDESGAPGFPTQTDSIYRLLLSLDSMALDSVRRTIPESDSVTLARFDKLRQRVDNADSTQRRRLAYDVERRLQIDSTLIDSLNTLPVLVGADTSRHKRGWLMSDSMSLSKVCWLSVVLPGYGQIYNKQYWKLPILYGLVGTGLAMYFHESSTYRPLKRQYDALVSAGNTRTPELDAIQTKMIRSNTRRQLYLGATIASYIYFIGDAAVKYATNDVSHVKKATTLACICPGAGQIYNKSYWKVPFVIGGFASLIYCVDWNNRGFQRFQKAYNLKYEWDQTPAADRPAESPDEFRGRYSASFLKNLKDSYRRNRDLCIIVTAGLYILQIVDAHVDAHLKDYDISDDLTMNIEPMVNYAFSPSAGGQRPVFGFNLSLNF